MGGLQFLSPEWLYALGPLLGLLVILYFLKLKRREVVVASTYLWKKALEDLRVNSPFQRLRMNILLLLQLLILAAILLALSRPVASLKGITGRDHVILLDRSASMSATDGAGAPGGQTRLARGLEEARRIVDGLSLGDKAVIVAFDEQAELLTSLTDQRTVLKDALARIAPTERRTRLRDAIEVVRGMLGNMNAPVLTIVSDGRVGDTRSVGVPANVEVHFLRVGEPSENFAVTSLEVRRAFEGGEASRVFATVYNASDKKRSVGVDCFLDANLVASKELEVPAHEQASVAFESEKLRVGHLRVSLDSQDALPLDDVAYAILREKKDVRVLLVTDGNPFLEKGLAGDPVVRTGADGRVPTVHPAQFAADDPGLRAFDLIVLDRVEPKTLGPGNYLCIDSLPPFEGLRPRGNVQRPSVVDWDEGHPISRFVSFGSLDVAFARRYEVRKADRVIVTSTSGDGPRERPAGDGKVEGAIPLIFEARDGDRHALVLAFDLMKTQSWPLRAAYPIFLANVVRWLGGAGREERALAVRTGEVAELPVPKGATKATVFDPARRERKIGLKPEDDVLRFADTATSGFYEVKFEGGPDLVGAPSLWFAANLGSADESEIAPLDKIELENLPVKGETRAADTRRELWKALVVLAFGVLLLEWWVYNRRVYV